MKDLIIGCSTNYKWDQLKYWINSINKSGFEGDKVLILMNCDKETVQKINQAGFHVVGFGNDEQGNLVYQSNMMVHVERFLHIYNILRQNDYRFVITTDVKDVIFQHNPIPQLEKYVLGARQDLVFASESILYKDEPWGNQNLMDTFGVFFHEQFKNNEIYNVGVLAGRGHAMRDLCCNIFSAAVNRIPICDQSYFNFLISQEPYKSTARYCKSEDGWACQLGTTADPSKIDYFRPLLLEPSPQMIDGKVVTSRGKEFTIVHQYDRVPEWRSIIEKTYG